MDIKPLYELKDRLRAAAIAGTSLLSEDFRLKKAAESFKALEGASPVFKKISDLTAELLSDKCADKAGVLLDTVTLVDSVICTLGAVDTNGEFSDIEVSEQPSAMLNVPYSKLSEIIGALTTSGGGQYNKFMEIKRDSPELLRDYRVKPLLIKGLGASYSELADEVGETVLGMGREMLPLLKNGFDPKGKKEMLRRASVIERLGGKDENAFYLEALETAEKDIRERLIYALRHDEGNFEKLVELTKTEKGKFKTAALSALATFDNNEAANFFNEMAKKKPDEVLALMPGASSEWSSKLTARLIDELLIDENGNKVTLTQAQDFKKVKLKGKAGYGMMANAITGKFGAEIENIYREYKNGDYLNTLDFKLGDAVLITDNEDLKDLALELNGNSKKGDYIYSEAIVRMLRGASFPDNLKWFDEQVKRIYKKEQIGTPALVSAAVIRAVKNIRFENGNYSLCIKEFDEVLSKWVYKDPRPIDRAAVHTVIDVLLKYPCVSFDSIMYDLADTSDTEYCKKLADAFIYHSLSKSFGSTISLMYLPKLGVTNVKGLALRYCQYNPNPHNGRWDLQGFFNTLRGDNEYLLSEAREIVKLLRTGELKMKLTDEDILQFSDWAENRFK